MKSDFFSSVHTDRFDLKGFVFGYGFFDLGLGFN